MEWTVLVFLNADNDLEQFGIQDINEMELVGTTERVKIVVQIDRIPGHDDTNGDWTSTRRYLITKDSDPNIINSALLQDMGEIDMGNPAVLTEFIEWGKQNFPAQRYCVVVWNHGSGWRSARTLDEDVLTKAVSFDETNDSFIRTIDLPAALAAAPRLDLVAFDASLMQMAEVLYEMRDSVGVAVGSEESPPGDGYAYHKWLGRLAARPTMTAEALGTTIVTEFIEFYTGRASVTQSAIRTDKLEVVAAAVDQLAAALTPHVGLNAGILKAARDSSQKYAFPDFKDLLDYAQEVSLRLADPAVTAAANAVATALDEAVIHEGHTGTSVSDSNGLSIWVPNPTDFTARQTEYRALQFAADTNWDEFLDSQTQ